MSIPLTIVRLVRSLLLGIVRTEARILGLKGTDRIARLVYSPHRREKDYLELLLPYGDSIIRIDTRSFIEWSIYIHNGYEVGAVKLLRSMVQPGSIILDVGANIGTFTLPLSRAVGSNGAVHAFEPHPRLRERLIMNVALNNLRNVSVCDFALGLTPGKATLYGSITANQGMASLRPQPGVEEPFPCDVDTIDHYVTKSFLNRVDLIKIDAQGADFSILAGAKSTLMSYRPSVYCEVAPSDLSLFKSSPEDIYELLTGLGYEIWRNKTVERGRLKLIPVKHGRVASALESWFAFHPGNVNRVSLVEPSRVCEAGVPMRGLDAVI